MMLRFYKEYFKIGSARRGSLFMIVERKSTIPLEHRIQDQEEVIGDG